MTPEGYKLYKKVSWKQKGQLRQVQEEARYAGFKTHTKVKDGMASVFIKKRR